MVARRVELMPRSARRYDFYLPLTDNAGRPIADAAFDDVDRQLMDRFGGLTAQQRAFPLRGMWEDKSQLYHDLVIIMTVLDFRRRGSAAFIARLKQDVLREFDQLEILITEQSLRVH
jgi:hypothetical protein